MAVSGPILSQIQHFLYALFCLKLIEGYSFLLDFLRRDHGRVVLITNQDGCFFPSYSVRYWL
jgi:histidinol phosphatase-like enzyme